MGFFENLQYKFDSMKTDREIKKMEKEGERLYRDAINRIDAEQQKKFRELNKVEEEKPSFDLEKSLKKVAKSVNDYQKQEEKRQGEIVKEALKSKSDEEIERMRSNSNLKDWQKDIVNKEAEKRNL